MKRLPCGFGMWAGKLLLEDERLLLCLKAGDDPDFDAAVEAFASADWEGVVRRAAMRGVSPLLFRQCRSSGLESLLSESAYERLRKDFLRGAGRNTRMFHRLSSVLCSLKSAGIPVVVLKGAHLAHEVYPELAFREMQDVDILVDKTDLSRCQKLLEDLREGASPLGFPIDLHWELETNVLPLRIDTSDLWRRAVPATIAGAEVLVLSPEDLVLHLCVHLANHHLFRYAGLRTLFDIRECVGRYGSSLDWGMLTRTALGWRAGNAVFVTLSAAKDLAGAEVPQSVLERLEPDGVYEDVMAWACSRMFDVPGFEEEPELSPNFCMLFDPGSPRRKLKRLLDLVFPSKEVVSKRFDVKYGSGSNYLHYIVRLREALPAYGRAVRGMVRRDEKVAEWVERQRWSSNLKKWLSAN